MWTKLLRKLFPVPSAARSRRPNLRRKCRCCVERLEDRLVLSLLGLQLFPADNAWNQNIGNAPLAANSAAIIANIGVSTRVHPDWGADSPANGSSPLYGIPFNIVHGDSTATVNVLIDNYPAESDIVPVPIPQNAVLEGDYQNGPNPNGGGYGENGNKNQRGDSHLLIWDDDHNIAYELYGVSRPNDPTLFPNNNDMELAKTDTAWHAAQETVWNMKANTFRTLGATSADAAGLSILAGLARPDEGLTVSEGGQGAINHALRVTLPKNVVNPQYIYPASHVVNDSQASNKLPFGARLRLANTPAINTLIGNMPAESQIVARAMQQYGLIVADIGSAMFVTGASATVDNVDPPNSKLTWNLADIFASNGLKTLNAGDFEVVDLTPRVTGLSATSGPAGSSITITGQNFSGSAGQLTVFFGGTPASSSTVVVVSDSQINAVAPNGSGTVDITVQSGVMKADKISGSPNANVTKPIFGYGKSATSSADKFTYGPPTLTWKGISNGNWTDPQWSGSSLPYPDNTANAIVHTANIVQVTSPQAAYSLSINSGGQVAVAQGASLSVTTDTGVTAGGALNVDANGYFSTGGTLTLDTGGSVTGGSVTAADFQFNDGTIRANLSGSGRLTKNTSGTVTLAGTNTYTGATSVLSGVLVVANGGALPLGTSLVIGGTSGATATITIAASDANGNPLAASAATQTSGTAAVVALTANREQTSVSDSTADPPTSDPEILRGNAELTQPAAASATLDISESGPTATVKLTSLDTAFASDLLAGSDHRRSEWLGGDMQTTGDESPAAGLAYDLPESRLRQLLQEIGATRFELATSTSRTHRALQSAGLNHPSRLDLMGNVEGRGFVCRQQC